MKQKGKIPKPSLTKKGARKPSQHQQRNLLTTTSSYHTLQQVSIPSSSRSSSSTSSIPSSSRHITQLPRTPSNLSRGSPSLALRRSVTTSHLTSTRHQPLSCLSSSPSSSSRTKSPQYHYTRRYQSTSTSPPSPPPPPPSNNNDNNTNKQQDNNDGIDGTYADSDHDIIIPKYRRQKEFPDRLTKREAREQAYVNSLPPVERMEFLRKRLIRSPSEYDSGDELDSDIEIEYLPNEREYLRSIGREVGRELVEEVDPFDTEEGSKIQEFELKKSFDPITDTHFDDISIQIGSQQYDGGSSKNPFTEFVQLQKEIREAKERIKMREQLEKEGMIDAPHVREFLDSGPAIDPLTGEDFDYNYFVAPQYKALYDLYKKAEKKATNEEELYESILRKNQIPSTLIRYDHEVEKPLVQDPEFRKSGNRKYKVLPTRTSPAVDSIEEKYQRAYDLAALYNIPLRKNPYETEQDKRAADRFDFEFSPSDFEGYYDALDETIEIFSEQKYNNLRQFYRFDKNWVEKLRKVQRGLRENAGLPTTFIDDDGTIDGKTSNGDSFIIHMLDTAIAEISLSTDTPPPSPGKFYLNFSTNVRPLYAKTQVESISARFISGQQSIVADDGVIITDILPGLVQVWKKSGDKPREWFVPGGMIVKQVKPFPAVLIQAQEAIPLEHLDINEARTNLINAREKLRTEKDENERIELSICEETCFGILHAFDISEKKLSKDDDNVLLRMTPLLQPLSSDDEVLFDENSQKYYQRFMNKGSADKH